MLAEAVDGFDEEVVEAHAGRPGGVVLGRPLGVAAGFGQEVIEVFEGVVLHAALQPADADAFGDDFFVDLVVVVAAAIPVKEADHLIARPAGVVDAAAHKVVVAADPVGIVGDVSAGEHGFDLGAKFWGDEFVGIEQ